MANLDAAYANAVHIPDGAGYPARWAQAAAAFRAGADALLDQPYGPGPREMFDLFRPSAPARGTVVFVHGGYWMAFDKSVWSHLAAGPLARGYAVAMLSYDLCPAVRIGRITRQVARAVDRIAAVTHGPLVLTGHSAGGHLVARMGCADVAPKATARIAGIVPISPLGDLRPLLRTSMNATLGLDKAEAAAESPMLFPRPAVPVTVFVGGDERPAFLDQARWLGQSWGAYVVISPGLHHFNVIAGLEHHDSPLTRALTP